MQSVGASSDPILLGLLERCRRDHRAWINGDGAPYALPDDGAILGAVGGWAPGGRATAARQVAVAQQWTSGTGTVELVNGGVDGDLARLALIERATVHLVGQVAPRRWDLRMTEVWHRAGERWDRVHRHADPLVERHDLYQLANLVEARDAERPGPPSRTADDDLSRRHPRT